MDSYQDFREIARSLNVDAVALVPGANFTRAFNASFHSMERPMLIVVPVNGPACAIVPNLELASFQAIGFEGEVFDWRDQDGYHGAFDALAKTLPIKSLAVEGQVMRVFVAKALKAAHPDLDIRDAEAEISALRVVKTEDEVQALRRAITISERALSDVVAAVQIGMTEREVESKLIAALFAHGAQGLAFEPIVAGGANSAMPHTHAGDYKLQRGDALLFDFGAMVDGLNADITRTFFVGEASAEQRAVYNTVLEANAAAFARTKPGVSAHDIDDAATSVLEASEFADRIRTKTGHGLGRQVHEAPQIMRGNMQVLAPGMVFTNEPGLYHIGGFGVRIEDDVLVTVAGATNLTTFPKELTVIAC